MLCSYVLMLSLIMVININVIPVWKDTNTAILHCIILMSSTNSVVKDNEVNSAVYVTYMDVVSCFDR